MYDVLPRWARQWIAPFATGLAYYLAAFGALSLTVGDAGIATLWPASGVLLATILLIPKRRLPVYVMAAAVGSLAANLQARNPALMSIGFTIANIGEAIIAAWLLFRRASDAMSLVRPGGLTLFCLSSAIAAASSATLAWCIAGTRSTGFWLSWFATDLLGILAVTPLIIIVGRHLGQRRSGQAKTMPRRAFLALGVVGVSAVVTFGQSSYPLLFVPMLAVLSATFLLGPVGAAGGVLIVTFVSAIATSLGLGPQSLIDAGPFGRNLFVQFYLLALFASALPVASLLAARARLIDQLREKMRLLQLAEGAAKVGHWRLDFDSETLTWSPEVFRIHGVAQDWPLSLEAALAAYHPDDRATVSANIDKALNGEGCFAFNARIVRPDGSIRHVFSRGEIDSGGGSGPVGLFGIIQDVTSQIEHASALEVARASAEAAAAHAIRIAEIDPLTGVANRRRIETVLDLAIKAGVANRSPMSIAVLDIDHFKRVNDVFGHQTGDEVLRRTATGAASVLRTGDTLGRFGGEEFVIVLPGAHADTAMLVAERVRSAIESDWREPRVTISVGVADLHDGETGEDLFRRADAALYAAKSEGRNRLHIAA
ncbi:sensor domain-containing diguanylate cyclase [Sphingomonas spermidinifaciens]|uniref:sensor domain-containing diguanylate cyclase n=1 Tax=Sphingomonas spermidinifaciens TaxID=1141889 RepID=UPI0015968594|nr:sensor domain-containing diguanylate cyclase [Sphingomonas spermidinifaciens]